MKNSIVFDDLYRYTGQRKLFVLIKMLFSNKSFRQLYLYRKVQATKGLTKVLYRFLLRLFTKSLYIELPHSAVLGSGALFIHPIGITINSKAIIGKNLTMLKGSTIGNCKRGELEGAPVIGDNVYIGLNSTVVGNIKIGNDVMICANTFVNFDVPDHSIVLGSPGIVHHKDWATEGYIINQI